MLDFIGTVVVSTVMVVAVNSIVSTLAGILFVQLRQTAWQAGRDRLVERMA